MSCVNTEYKLNLNILMINNNKIVKHCIYHIILLILFNQIHFVRLSNDIVDTIKLNYEDSGGGRSVSRSSSSDFDDYNLEYPKLNFSSTIQQNHSNRKSIRSSSSNKNDVNESFMVGENVAGNYFNKLDNLERSVGAVLMKVAYGTTSTTKRSIPDSTYVPSLTTIATPPLTTTRYIEKHSNKQQTNQNHRNYELDLERDHALPTSAPNADILKSNSNPLYPNPNRHHNHDRDRHRHLFNSTPTPSLQNPFLNKGQPSNTLHNGEMPSYFPPSRSFFTPPLPPEFQNPFADKPILRGSNNNGVIVPSGGSSSNNNQQFFINRRPIPPPSLMPGHERIPFRPPELNSSLSISQPLSKNLNVKNNKNNSSEADLPNSGNISPGKVNENSGSGTFLPHNSNGGLTPDDNQQQRKTLNTPSEKHNHKPQTEPAMNSESNLSDIQNQNEDRVPNIPRILSGSNGQKEDIPEILLKHVTSRPTLSNDKSDSAIEKNKNKEINEKPGGDASFADVDDDEFDSMYPFFDSTTDLNDKNKNKKGGVVSKTQLVLQANNEPIENQYMSSNGAKSPVYSTQKNVNIVNEREINYLTTLFPTKEVQDSHYEAAQAAAAAKNTKKQTKNPNEAPTIGHNSRTPSGTTWDVSWNIHIYLSIILYTMLGVYSIFKMIFYNKLSYLFSQSYFIWINMTLIIICVSRIFYLIYDAYNIHNSFPIFISDLLLNLPASFLTIAFSILILFLLIRSLNLKTNRYSALIRPLTVLVGSLVHVFLCITLHLVESYTTMQNNHLNYYYLQQQHQLRAVNNGAGAASVTKNGVPILLPPPPPKVLSLIWQIIYIFICLSLGLLYLYIYRILKRVLRSKSQNYIHGYQNLSYAIHITIATALLFVLLAALQIFGAISISTSRAMNMTNAGSEVDWLLWGYQFSLRLIEIAIIWLMSWVVGLKTGGASSVIVQREKGAGDGRSTNGNNPNNVSGFILFPCTSSSSQEQFETDYPAICNTNTNLHTYTLRTGKPIYDDNFALNSIHNGNGSNVNMNTVQPRHNDFQQKTDPYARSFETSSLRSGRNGNVDQNNLNDPEFLRRVAANDEHTDHYENPNFELQGPSMHYHVENNVENCYAEPLNPMVNNYSTNEGQDSLDQQFNDFQNFERPSFQPKKSRNNIDYNSSTVGGPMGYNTKSKHNMKCERSGYDNLENRSSSSAHSFTNGRIMGNPNVNEANPRNYNHYNSFDRRNRSVRKSGTLNNIGSGLNTTKSFGNGRSGSSSSSASSRSYHKNPGVQTLSSQKAHKIDELGPVRMLSKGSLERINAFSGGPMVNGVGGGVNIHQQHVLPSEDELLLIGNSQAERTNLISSSHCSGNSSDNDFTGGITSSTSGSNLTTDVNSTLNEANLIKQRFAESNGNPNLIERVNGGKNANGNSMLVAEHGFVRFRALDDINNAQGVGIHNASMRASTGRNREKRFTNNT